MDGLAGVGLAHLVEAEGRALLPGPKLDSGVPTAGNDQRLPLESATIDILDRLSMLPDRYHLVGSQVPALDVVVGAGD